MPTDIRSIVVFALIAWSTSFAAERVDFTKLTSPIIFQGDFKFGYGDPAALYHEGRFYLYFTVSETAADGGYYKMIGFSTSPDLVHWTFPRILTPRDRSLNYSSPGNVVRFRDQWVLCLQTYPTTEAKMMAGNESSRIWIVRSKDLMSWSEPELLRVKGPNVPISQMGRMIDPFLIEDQNEPGKWWCFYKQNGVSMSYSYDLKNWTYAGSAQAGENVTILRQARDYVMFHSPLNGIGVKRSSNLLSWGPDVQLLTLGQEQWPWAQGRLTAATVLDLTKEPAVGKYVMFFHGESREGIERFPYHGASSIGVAWSDDLVHWSWPRSESFGEAQCHGSTGRGSSSEATSLTLRSP
jgi:hypothetical protein